MLVGVFAQAAPPGRPFSLGHDLPTIYEIPVTPGGGNQTFTIELGDTTYRFALNWRAATDGGWTLDIADSGGTAMVNGIPLLPGGDLLAPFKHLEIEGGLYVVTDGDPEEPPTFDNLGQTAHIYWVTQ